jgi:2-succinyl-5-enolpyruvyl-6-hydroxy-3-cyclohexene-1-carboxylate synthase
MSGDTSREGSAAAFEADPGAVYAFVDRFFASLAASGVEHVCISPGSRSTPLAIAAERAPGLRTWIGLDERAASFFAIGLAKATGRSVAVLCTSGTAAANYLPAVVEAHYSRVPLIVLTADRPSELRDWGAGQTIEQTGLYGRYPRWTTEVPIPSRGEDVLRYATRLAARAVDESSGDSCGPVHLNWPLREPLAPESLAAVAEVVERATPRFSRAPRTARSEDVEELTALAREFERGVICCGPMDAGGELVAALRDFASAAGWPILAGPASQLRGTGTEKGAPLLSMADAFLRAPSFASKMRPDVVLRIGETPVSKAQRLWVEASDPKEVWWLDEGWSWGEPSHRFTRVVRGGAMSLLERATTRLTGFGGRARTWCREFEVAEGRARQTFEAFILRPGNFSGLTAAASVVRGLAAGDTLFVSNSMSVRLLDLAHDGSTGPLRVLCNRGASGIDGITSTALGVAAGNEGRTALLTGDLALLHDLSGLLAAKQAQLDLVIVVLDDDGGGIFSYLPIAEHGEEVRFERLFGTPHGLDLSRVAALFELEYARATTMQELDAGISEGLRVGGIHLIHVPLNRKRNEARFREALAQVAASVDSNDVVNADPEVEQ